MDISLAYATAMFIAGFIFIISPGPNVIRIITFVSEFGVLKALKYSSGSLVAATIWFVLTMASFIESEKLPKEIFIFLTLACSVYLFFIGMQMITRVSKNKKLVLLKNPFIDGFILSLFNPKNYPILLAVLGVVTAKFKGVMSWDNFEIVLIFIILGLAFGYITIILCANLKIIRKYYLKHLNAVSIVFGLVFIGFGANLILGLFY